MSILGVERLRKQSFLWRAGFRISWAQVLSTISYCYSSQNYPPINRNLVIPRYFLSARIQRLNIWYVTYSWNKSILYCSICNTIKLFHQQNSAYAFLKSEQSVYTVYNFLIYHGKQLSLEHFYIHMTEHVFSVWKHSMWISKYTEFENKLLVVNGDGGQFNDICFQIHFQANIQQMLIYNK